MAIDLTDRIIQPAPAPKKGRWNPWRRVAQILCGVLLVALPLTNGMRLDVRRHEFYFAWHRTAAQDLLMLFWVSMLATWALVAVSVLYGRLWCGWICPQTMASDFADSLKKRLDKALRTRPGQPRFALSRGIWSLILLAMSVGTGMAVAAYWLAPAEVGRAALRPWTDVPAALTVYIIAAVVAADMLWVRRKFCFSACPYGPLMGIVADKNTLAVRYLNEREDDCIKCGKCVVDCPMGIDIKQGAGQLACINCGICVDSCNDVLGKRGKAGLIEYRYGLEPERATSNLSWKQRLGFWDATRFWVLATLLVFAGYVGLSLFGHEKMTVNAIANGAITQDASGIHNGYLLTVQNGTPEPQTYALSVDGMNARAEIDGSQTLTLAPREQRAAPLILTGNAAPGERKVVTLNLVSAKERAKVPLVFYRPQ